MSGFQKDFHIGSLCLPNNVFFAPLAGCSDLPFRKMALEFFRPGLFFCEMVKIEALTRKDKTTLRMLDYDPLMHPIGAQICGSVPSIAAEAAKMVEDFGFDLIDLNCGCPVDKVTRDGSGSALLKNPEKIGEMLFAICQSVKIPVTVKIRSGWDDKTDYVEEIVKIAEEAGAKAITIHGRTRKQGYRGNSDWEKIRKGKEKAKKILVLGNGDLFSADAVEKMFSSTLCDGVVLARGTLGHPWIVEEIFLQSQKQEIFPKTAVQVKQILLRHFDLIVQEQKDAKKVLFEMRKVGVWYLKHFPGMKALRISLNQAPDAKEAYSLIENASKESF